MRSCTSPVGRLKSHQRGFWIETLVLCPGDLLSKSSNFFQKKVVGGQSPVNDRHSKAGKFWSWGVDAQEFPGGIPEAEHVLAFCQDSFRMTLSRVGFLTLAPDKGSCGSWHVLIVNSFLLLNSVSSYSYTSLCLYHIHQLKDVQVFPIWKPL